MLVIVYMLLSIILGLIWLKLHEENQIPQDMGVFITKDTMKKSLETLGTTTAGAVLFICLFVLYNFFILPWAGIGFMYKWLKKTLFIDKKGHK